jgi:hypothetical protein
VLCALLPVPKHGRVHAGRIRSEALTPDTGTRLSTLTTLLALDLILCPVKETQYATGSEYIEKSMGVGHIRDSDVQQVHEPRSYPSRDGCQALQVKISIVLAIGTAQKICKQDHEYLHSI